jgi:hypothetical protein
MKSKLFACCLIGLAVGACQPQDYVDPSDDPTGNPPPPATQIFAFDAAAAPRFVNANLEASNALQAEFTVVNDVLVPMQAGGAFPATAGADADLLAGVGFGTYPNTDRTSDAWTAGSFQSVLTADVILSQAGDAVKFCRSFATTCVEAKMLGDGQGVVVLTLAANVPDTEIGEIAPGVSAAIRGTGENGLTIAVTDPNVVAVPFAPTANTPFTLEWTIARGPMPGSIQYGVSVNGAELASGDTLTALGGSITATGGVALMFDQPVVPDVLGAVDYSYEFQGDTGDFSDPLNLSDASVDLSPQLGLGAAPLYLYPTRNPGIDLLTLSGDPLLAHPVQPTDAVLGALLEPPGASPQTKVYSAGFNGDDFADTQLAGLVDQSGAGGGFYPSPAFCYAQIYPMVEAQVRAAVREGTRALMYANVATGVALADAGLELLAGQLAAGGAPVTYTRLGDVATGDLAAYIAIGTDYANSNLDMNIATSEDDLYTAVLNDTASQTFRDQLVAIVTAAEAAQIFEPTDPRYLALKKLQIGLTTPPGSKELYEVNVAANLKDQINGNDDLSRPPVLAQACLWGIPAKETVDARDATLVIDLDSDGNPLEVQNFGNDKPATPAIAATPAVAPVREQAASQINALIIGIYSSFISQVFGPTVPASNFSLSMEIGDPASGSAPGVSSILISAQ